MLHPEPVPTPAPIPAAPVAPIAAEPTPLPSAPPKQTLAEPTPSTPASTPEPTAGADASAPQKTAIEALQAARQSSAADALDDAVWTVFDGEARIQTELSPTMLPAVLNPEAEKIVRAALRTLGIPRVVLLAGASAVKAAPKKARAPRTGSAQAKALEHPMVQQAQKLFNAEIQTVIDLSGDN